MRNTLARLWNFVARYFYAIGCAVYAFSFGLFRNRMFVYQTCEYFGWAQPDWLNRPPELVPEGTVAQIVPDDLEIRIDPSRVSGNISVLEMVVINKIVRWLRPGFIFEIGTFDGLTTLNMAINCDQCTVFTLDLPSDKLGKTVFDVCDNEIRYINKAESGARFTGTKHEGKIQQLHGDSGSFDFSPYYNSIDLMFVDGSHSYDYVISDTEVAVRLCNRQSRSVILWHDYGEWPDVTRALNELYQRDARFKELKRVKGTSLVVLIVEGGERLK